MGKLNDTIEQLRGMRGFVDMAKNAAFYTPTERHGYLTFAVMHACQASIFGDREYTRYGFSIHDYKHVLIKAVEAIMGGKSIDEVMKDVPEYQSPTPIEWDYLSKQ